MSNETAADIRVVEYLQGRSDSCPACQYDLRDLTTDVCPECGTELTLELALVDPAPAAWIVGLASLSATLSIPGLLIGIYLLALISFRSGPLGIDWEDAISFWQEGGWLICIYFFVIAQALEWWLDSRRKINAMPTQRRQLLATICVCVFPLSIALYYLTLHELF